MYHFFVYQVSKFLQNLTPKFQLSVESRGWQGTVLWGPHVRCHSFLDLLSVVPWVGLPVNTTNAGESRAGEETGVNRPLKNAL